VRLAQALTLSLALPNAPTPAAIPPDDGLAARQAEALTAVAADLVPFRPYPGTSREDCVIMSTDGMGIVARLELNRRGLPGGADPATAEPWVQHIAEAIPRLYGTGAVEGFCHYNRAGAPGIIEAAAQIAYALHRYGAGWSGETKEMIRVAVEDSSWQVNFYLVNGNIATIAAELLAGEALDRAVLWDRGVGHLDAVYTRTLAHGGIEMNAPLYTAQHLPMLVFMQALRDEGRRAKARILLEYELLFEGHMYLPGGGMSAPQSRDYSGGSEDGGSRAMLPVLWVLVGDPAYPVDLPYAYEFVGAAATDYAVPEMIRSIFLDKGAGYTFWAYTDAQQGSGLTPYAVYNLGLNGAQCVPWQTVVLPGGAGSLGVAYGFRNTALYVSYGLYSRLPSGAFAIQYHYQPMVIGDTDEMGGSMAGAGTDDDPDDFTSELYDYERMVYKRTALQLWDPRERPGVVRTHQYTKAWLPRYETLGGQYAALSGWRVGRVGDNYFAYRPLGALLGSQTVERDGGTFIDMDLGPLSGGIAEMATTADFPSLEAYLSDLIRRRLVFTTSPLAVEFDALDFETGQKVPVRLEYRPERRFIRGVEVSVEEALDHGLMDSPWADWDASSRRLTVARECYAPTVYDWAAGTVTTGALAPEWEAPPEVLGVSVEGRASATVSWAPAARASTYDVSRGLLSALDGADYGACRNGHDPDLTDTSHADADVPPAGDGFFYLVRGRNGLCQRAGSYGSDSGGRERANANAQRCP
jgi:hypothetical protein